MNDLTKEETIYGYAIVSETYNESSAPALTKKAMAIETIKDLAIEASCIIGISIGLTLQFLGLSYIAVLIFNMVAN